MKKNDKMPKICALALILTSLSLYTTACGTAKPNQNTDSTTGSSESAVTLESSEYTVTPESSEWNNSPGNSEQNGSMGNSEPSSSIGETISSDIDGIVDGVVGRMIR